MSANVNQINNQTARVQSLFMAVLAVLCAFGTVSNATAQRVTPPTTPIDIAVPEGNSPFLLGHAIGTQGYTCLPTSAGGTSWTLNLPAPKPRCLRVSSGSRFRSSLTSPVLMQTPNRTLQSLSAAMRRGRVRLTPARCGLQRLDISMPALIVPAVRIGARFNVSC